MIILNCYICRGKKSFLYFEAQSLRLILFFSTPYLSFYCSYILSLVKKKRSERTHLSIFRSGFSALWRRRFSKTRDGCCSTNPCGAAAEKHNGFRSGGVPIGFGIFSFDTSLDF